MKKCNPCQASYMRAWRKDHRLTPEQAKKANARSYAGMYLLRGNLQRQPCEACSADKAQMHHDDYDKPLQVRWLCRGCHLAHHKVAAAAQAVSSL